VNTLRQRCSLAVVVCFFLLSGCGYAFQGSGSILPDDVKTITILQAENNTTEPGLGLQLTEKLRSRFERYGAVKVVPPGRDADAELITRILQLQNRVRDTTGNTDIALEYELEITISAVLRRRNGQVLYRNSKLRASEIYPGVSDVVVTSSSAFAQAGIGSDTLDTLGSREVSRGARDAVLEDLMEETSRKLYLDAVSAEF